MSNLFNNMYHTLPIDIAFISQQITPIDLDETDNHITELDDIIIDSVKINQAQIDMNFKKIFSL